MKTAQQFREHEETAKSECRIIAAYEDAPTRERAMTLIGHLKRTFQDEIDFACTWWKFRYLMDQDIAMIARHYATSADIVVFSSDAPGLFPLSIMNWIESWTHLRSKDGGVMVPLIGSPYIPQKLYSTKIFYLQRVAERAGLDYLPQSMLMTDPPIIPIPNIPMEPSSTFMHGYHDAPSRTPISSD